MDAVPGCFIHEHIWNFKKEKKRFFPSKLQRKMHYWFAFIDKKAMPTLPRGCLEAVVVSSAWKPAHQIVSRAVERCTEGRNAVQHQPGAVIALLLVTRTQTWLRDRDRSFQWSTSICIKLNTIQYTFRYGHVLSQSIPPSCSLVEIKEKSGLNFACIVSAATKCRHCPWTTRLLKALGTAVLIKAVKFAGLICLWWLHHFETAEDKCPFPVLLFQAAQEQTPAGKSTTCCISSQIKLNTCFLTTAKICKLSKK